MFTPIEIEESFRKIFGMYNQEKVKLLKFVFKEEIENISPEHLAWEYSNSAVQPHEYREMLSVDETGDWQGLPFQYLRQYGQISEDALDFLVQDNAIIPDNRAKIIREGLYLALNERLYSAMHILQPQSEHIFRHLVKMCGDTVTFLKEDGHEEYKPLSALFKSEKLA